MSERTVRDCTDCCGNLPTHRSREVEGRLYCDHQCFVREYQRKWDAATIRGEGGVERKHKDNVLELKDARKK